MADEKLQRLIDNALVEMGPELFRQFQDDMAGRKKAPPHLDLRNLQWIGRVLDVDPAQRRVRGLRRPR